MATLAAPLAILDACGTASSIARFTDGNATPPKNLTTLHTTQFGGAAGSILDWVGLQDSKSVSNCNYTRVGSCFSSGYVYTCDCLVVNPAMVLGDRYDANLCIKAYSNCFGACGIVRVTCNNTQIFNCVGIFSSSINCSITLQDIDYNDTIRITLCSYAPTGSGFRQGCACFTITSITDQQQASFVVGSPSSQFAVAQATF